MTSAEIAPAWLWAALDLEPQEEGASFQLGRDTFVVKNGIPRASAQMSDAQEQTEETFAFKWKKTDTFDSPVSLARMKSWLVERYGDVPNAGWLSDHGEAPILVDAGCGGGMSGLELLGPLLPKLRYLGVDVSEAVDVARRRFADAGHINAAFMQADISQLPITPGTVDLIFSEGVLHHTDSTERATKALARLLKPGGRFMFYVYKKKGPVREFTDDYVRERLQGVPPEEAWRLMEPLTKLGILLGQLDQEIDIPEPIDLLEIPAGRINLQRFFYWHVAKVFFRPELTFDEMNHINFDWYAPKNAARQTPAQVRQWCVEAGLEIEREVVENAGITIIARKT